MQSAAVDLKQTLQILERVQDFESRYELRRFLLIMALCGFVAILAGWIELVSQRYMDTDPAFILAGLRPSPQDEPELFIATWLIHLAPIFLVGVYTSQSPALLDWSPLLRKIGLLWLILIAMAEIGVVTIGFEWESLIPVIWTSTIFFAFLGTYWMVPEIEGLPSLRVPIRLMAILCVATGAIATLILKTEHAMFFFATTIGLGMVAIAAVYYFKAQ
ncbi:MAG: hypothetical protein ACFFB3_21770 [Candidatus Hodarchaeota archaeon]